MKPIESETQITAARSLPGLPRTIEWLTGPPPILRLLDQTQLPERIRYLDCANVEEVRDAIYRLAVRGAPAIGVAAAYGLCLGTREAAAENFDYFDRTVTDVAAILVAARPTAVNLSWAVERVRLAGSSATAVAERWQMMLAEAHRIAEEDRETCRLIGEAGKHLIRDGMSVLTHCNAGALATAGMGTALAILYAAHANGRRFKVFADETRPLLQGARLTAFELNAYGIDTCILCDNAAASLMAAKKVDLVVVGADRIAANGDSANKIGTYGLAVLSQYHGIPFYVVAPRSTFDLRLTNGSGIPIETRPASEIQTISGTRVAPEGVSCYNPAFDVTPAGLITGIVTEFGILEPVTEKIREIFAI